MAHFCYNDITLRGDSGNPSSSNEGLTRKMRMVPTQPGMVWGSTNQQFHPDTGAHSAAV